MVNCILETVSSTNEDIKKQLVDALYECDQQIQSTVGNNRKNSFDGGSY